MVPKPGVDKVERILVWSNKLSDLLFREVCTISATGRWYKQASYVRVWVATLARDVLWMPRVADLVKRVD